VKLLKIKTGTKAIGRWRLSGCVLLLFGVIPLSAEGGIWRADKAEGDK
jgi:hypothetical protein